MGPPVPRPFANADASLKTVSIKLKGARTDRQPDVFVRPIMASPPLPSRLPMPRATRHHHVCRKVFSPSRWQSGWARTCSIPTLRMRRLGQMNTRAAATALSEAIQPHRWPSSPRTRKRPHLVSPQAPRARMRKLVFDRLMQQDYVSGNLRPTTRCSSRRCPRFSLARSG